MASEPLHIVAHSVLYGSLAVALAAWLFPSSSPGAARVVLAAGAFLLVAGSQELAQALSRSRLPGGEELFDLVVDAAGASVGLIVWSLFDRRRVYPLARSLGVALHPGFIGPLGVFALAWSTLRDTRAALGWTLVLVLAVLPLAATWWVGLKRGWYSDRDLSVRAERPRFLLLALVAATVILVAVHLVDAPAIVRDITTANLIATALFTLTTVVGTKVSGHVAVPVGVVVLISATSSRGPWPFLIVALSVSWARVREGRHTPREVLAGWGIAGASCLLTRLVGS
ncbi:MAG: phosphatase PAP2 family protein [Labilithrix sp.]|nr:phosphatase PAP2 family protein [Labilithrix sp.]MCW5812477.1 phosphatase PAP2 family protein [Labilithrix sp.]